MIFRKILQAVYYVLIVAFQINCEFNVQNLRSKTPPGVQEQAALDVIQRLVPNFVDRVTIIIDPDAKPNSFEVNIFHANIL